MIGNHNKAIIFLIKTEGLEGKPLSSIFSLQIKNYRYFRLIISIRHNGHVVPAEYQIALARFILNLIMQFCLPKSSRTVSITTY